MEDSQTASEFDFAGHAQKATAEYVGKQAFYRDLAHAVSRILEECINARDIKIQTIQYRAKSPKSFSEKASIPSDGNPNLPRYPDPMGEITDLAGVRVITYFPDTLAEIDTLLQQEFAVAEQSDKGALLVAEEKFGYQSVHYLIKLKSDRANLSEYKRYDGALVEVQVRTVLQHAWAEIEHDIQYKSARSIPREIRRRFMALAGMLEIADREFQAIGHANTQLEKQAEESVEKGDTAGIEITPNSLKLFLDQKLGVDYRISDWTYDWTAGLLQQLGFRDLDQVERAIKPFNQDQLSYIAYGNRQGQTTRFELMLLAALGDLFTERHPWTKTDWFQAREKKFLKMFSHEGISTGTFDPDEDTIARGDMRKGWPDLIRKAQSEPSIWLDGKEWKRIRFGEEGGDHSSDACHDCGALQGQLHVMGCDVERCPACKNQFISCECNEDEDEDGEDSKDDPIVDDEPLIFK
jgi:ppGpp synthetase/RelA/SpoT-type nucleotidyltranferase